MSYKYVFKFKPQNFNILTNIPTIHRNIGLNLNVQKKPFFLLKAQKVSFNQG